MDLFRRLFGAQPQPRPPSGAEEDPHATLRHTIAAMERELARADASLRAVDAVRRDLDSRRARLEDTAIRYGDQAERALKVGHEELARQALALRSEVDRQVEQLDETRQEVLRQQAALEGARDDLRLRLEEIRSRQAELGTRLAAAEAQLRLREAVAASDDTTTAGRAVERLESRLEETRARAGALEELAPAEGNRQGNGDTLEQELNRLERAQRVDRELERIRLEAIAERNAPQDEEKRVNGR